MRGRERGIDMDRRPAPNLLAVAHEERLVSLSPDLLGAAGFDGYVKFVNPAWERRRLEEELERYTHRLERANAELQDFVYVASHDLSQPLRMVSAYLELLRRRYDDALDDDARQFISYAIDGAVRMQDLIDDLLLY